MRGHVIVWAAEGSATYRTTYRIIDPFGFWALAGDSADPTTTCIRFMRV